MTNLGRIAGVMAGWLTFSAGAAPAPTGIAFTGLVDSEWRLFVITKQGQKRIATTSEPRTPTYSKRLNRIAYIAADGSLREVDMDQGKESILLTPTPQVAYTQPAYRPQTDELYVVSLRERSSIETDIGRVDRKAQKLVPVLHQRSAQFEPTFTADGQQLIYSNVLCASECPNIIQEIWSMDVVGGIVRQLTMTNAVARHPAVSQNEVVFSSNVGGHYQLWRAAPGQMPTQLTHDVAVDEAPVVIADDLYFIRRDANGGQIMKLAKNGRLERVSLDASIKDVRDLRWGQP